MLSEVLKAFRTVNGYSLREVAERLGICNTTLYRIEQGKRKEDAECD